jgi:hypothetical protein
MESGAEFKISPVTHPSLCAIYSLSRVNSSRHTSCSPRAAVWPDAQRHNRHRRTPPPEPGRLEEFTQLVTRAHEDFSSPLSGFSRI